VSPPTEWLRDYDRSPLDPRSGTAKLEVDVEGHPHPVSFTVGEARRGGQVRCHGCGEQVAVDGAELDRELRKIEKELRDMGFR
jgi:lipoate-protein ligase B